LAFKYLRDGRLRSTEGAATHNGAVRIREPGGDLYAELGVAPTATSNEIAAAFRALARELHPDANPGANPGDTPAAERFKRVSMAYGELSDPVRRARYDASSSPAVAPAAAPAPAPAASSGAAGSSVAGGAGGWRMHFTRRGARRALGCGIALVVLGVVAAGWVVSLQRHDADLRASGVAAAATVVEVGGARRLEFTTHDGRTIRATEQVKTGEEQPAVGSRVAIHYDRHDPTSVVTDASHTARDVTLWIVAVKLVVGGAVLAVLGARRLRRE